MANKGLAFSLGGVKRPQAAKLQLGLAKPSKGNALAAFDTPDSDDDTQTPVQQAKRQRTEPAAPSGLRPPSDPEVEKVATKLAEFVARNGRQFEEVTRQRNPGDTPFKFLLDTSSADYKWYDQKILNIKNAMAGITPTVMPTIPKHAQPSLHPQQILPRQPPLPAQPMAPPVLGPTAPDAQPSITGRRFSEAQPAAAAAAIDPIAAMEAFARKAEQLEASKVAKEEKIALLKETSYDRRTVKAIYKDDGTRGHHMQDFIPADELAKVLAKSGDAAAQEHAKRIEEQSKIGADNIGHRLLSKMGWKEGSGLGASGSGMEAPVSASGSTALEKRGLGAKEHTQIEEGDDEFEQYRKRMMLGYKHRPNPLGNPRKSYY